MSANQSPATALVLEAPRRLVRRELPIPAIGDDGAILRVEACGLCGTDHELFTGALPWAPGFIPGHETVGAIESIGPAAARRSGVQVGDRVALASRPACRSCEPCRSGDLLVTGASGVSTASHARAFELLASGAFPWSTIPRRSAGFDDVADLLATMAGERGDDLPVHAVFVPDARVG